jgi:hypothetical protein
MTDKKISAMTRLTAPAAGDMIPVVDISEALDANKNKYLTPEDLHMPVFLTSPLTSADWDGNARSTTAKTLIDLSVVFGAPAGISAINLQILARDSGSAAGQAFFIVAPTADSYASAGGIWLQGVTNDKYREMNVICPCTMDGDIYYQCEATSTDSLNVTLKIWGYWL